LKISIIIPAYNEENNLLVNLPKIKNSFESNNFSNFEFIVCDNNSTDNTSKIANDFGAKVVFEPINQISRARNTGAKSATGDWLVFIDADSWPSKYLIQDLIKHISSGLYVGGSSIVQFINPPLWWRASWKISNLSMPLFNLTPTGSFMFCQRNVFEYLDGFNEELFILEDLDFSKDLRKYCKSINKKSIVIKQPSYTSSRRADNLKIRHMIKLAYRLSRYGTKTLKTKKNFVQWYSR
jgi:glycosyltransferase involved in cell wall biosynthesis|tara:strand:+ start:154 stop:867 length:714 start_codon:yes stop_codon:yes gene_type:complete